VLWIGRDCLEPHLLQSRPDPGVKEAGREIGLCVAETCQGGLVEGYIQSPVNGWPARIGVEAVKEAVIADRSAEV